MSIVAYPRGLSELRELELWRDIAAGFLRGELGRPPSTEEIEDLAPELEQKVLELVLRNNHAHQAEHLATVSLSPEVLDGGGYLIEDVQLRGTYGHLIGKIAHSHWWPIERVRQEFTSNINAPGYLPREWTVDPLKLAYLIRGADACHLDERRSPRFLQILRRPEGVAAQHWDFQSHMQRPELEYDRLKFSATPFPVEKAAAWWQCLDALRVVDIELRQIDALLADLGKPRFAARSVARVEEPLRLTTDIPTDGWTPVDARVKVSNVASLVRKLGGEALYGRDPSVPLRELVQNATDAVRARRLLEQRPFDWGDVCIRLGEDAERHWIEVEDNGVGMSTNVLTNSLLDFGSSGWQSPNLTAELPGLAAHSFQSTGKFGIGFFSLFMWGEHIRVTTRRYDAALQDTQILEFENGLESRPILKNAHTDECLRDGGTCTRVWLKNLSEPSRIFLHEGTESGSERWMCEVECATMFPTIDANLYLEAEGIPPKAVVKTSDWMHMPGKILLQRLHGIPESSLQNINERLELLGSLLRPIINSSGAFVGRACITPSTINRFNQVIKNSKHFSRPLKGDKEYSLEALVTVGGYKTETMSYVSGFFLGDTSNAARNTALPIAEEQALAEWASGQVELIKPLCDTFEQLTELAKIVFLFGGDTKDLPIASHQTGPISSIDLASTFIGDEIFVFENEDVILDGINGDMDETKLVLNPNCLISTSSTHVILETDNNDDYLTWPSIEGNSALNSFSKNLIGAIIKALSQRWGVTIDQVIAASDLKPRHDNLIQEIGMIGEEPVFASTWVIRKPRTSAI